MPVLGYIYTTESNVNWCHTLLYPNPAFLQRKIHKPNND